MTRSNFNAGLIQASFSDDRDKNWKKLSLLLEQAADDGTELVVLPELHNDLYFCQHEDDREFARAEPIPGPTTEFLSNLARRLNIVIVGSVFERRAAGLYHNTAVILDSDGSLAGCYRKMHIPDDPGYYEKYYFAPGDTGFKPVAARLMTLAGAELLVYPTAIGWDPADNESEQQTQLDSWITVQRGHAISNGIPLLAANRHGHETDSSSSSKGIDFWGNSFICGPQGEILAQASSAEDCLLQSEINFKHCEKVRQVWPFLRDRRIDAYTGLGHRFLDPVAGDTADKDWLTDETVTDDVTDDGD
jgi:N-carbamoylputrescine amidase